MVGQKILPVILLIFVISNASSFLLSSLQQRTMRFTNPGNSHASTTNDAASLDPKQQDIVNEAIDDLDLNGPNAILVTWTAAAKASVKVKEIGRSCEEYMALPASEYSVLTADQIVRLNDHQFKCVLTKLNFFGNIIQPVLYVDVNVYPDDARSEIVVVKAETIGSPVAEKINGSFTISAANIVTAGKDSKNRKILTSETNLKIEARVPKSKIPVRVIQSGGNFIIQSTLNVIVAAFIRVLAADFARWSAGNNSRDAVEGASLSD